jgi:hypothetical protein
MPRTGSPTTTADRGAAAVTRPEPDRPSWAALDGQGRRYREPDRAERQEQAVARAGLCIVRWLELPARPTTELLEKAQQALAEALKG